MLRRRDLSITINKVELRLYRRTRNCCDISRESPHFIYHVRFEWSGDTLPRSSPPCSPRSSPQSARSVGTRLEGTVEEPESWWESLPRSYTVKRRWHEIVRFHEALISNLTYDSVSGCNRVKSRIPTLPGKADLDSWTKCYGAIGDALALSRTRPVDPPSAVAPRIHHIGAPKDDLDGLAYIYVELRLAPYFAQVNNILHELPTNILAASVALRRFAVPGSRAATQKAPFSSNGVPRRFLGPLDPVAASAEDISAAVRLLRRSQPDALRSFSTPSLGKSSSRASTGLVKRSRSTATLKESADALPPLSPDKASS